MANETGAALINTVAHQARIEQKRPLWYYIFLGIATGLVLMMIVLSLLWSVFWFRSRHKKANLLRKRLYEKNSVKRGHYDKRSRTQDLKSGSTKKRVKVDVDIDDERQSIIKQREGQRSKHRDKSISPSSSSRKKKAHEQRSSPRGADPASERKREKDKGRTENSKRIKHRHDLYDRTHKANPEALRSAQAATGLVKDIRILLADPKSRTSPPEVRARAAEDLQRIIRDTEEHSSSRSSGSERERRRINEESSGSSGQTGHSKKGGATDAVEDRLSLISVGSAKVDLEKTTGLPLKHKKKEKIVVYVLH